MQKNQLYSKTLPSCKPLAFFPPPSYINTPSRHRCSSTSPRKNIQISLPEKIMYSPDGLPVQSTTGPRPLKRHKTAREIAHRVRESLTTRICKTICGIFLSVLVLVGIVAFILWLSFRPHRPRFHIHDFSIPGFGEATGFENVQITFNVTIRNSNQKIGIYYDAMGGSLYYKDQQVGSKQLLYPFYQEPKNTTVVADVLSGKALTVNSKRWTEFMNDRAVGTVAFRLEISSTIRFKIKIWNTKDHRAHANCDVSVGPDGAILPLFKEKRCPVYFT